MAPRLLAKSDPTAGALVSLYDGLSFLINNRQQLAGFFEGLADTMGNLAASINDPDPDVRTAKVAEFTRGIVTAVTDRGLNVLLDFAASQLGLGGLKRGVQNVIQFIPNQVDSLMRRIVGAVASRVTALLPGGGSTSLYGGLVGTVRTFSYQGQSYTLW